MPYKRHVGTHVPICEQMAVPVDGYVVWAFDGITTFVQHGVLSTTLCNTELRRCEFITG